MTTTPTIRYEVKAVNPASRVDVMFAQRDGGWAGVCDTVTAEERDAAVAEATAIGWTVTVRELLSRHGR